MNVRELIAELIKLDMDEQVVIGLKASGYHPKEWVNLDGLDTYNGCVVLIPEGDLEVPD